jgi:hypothetical protein
VRWLLLFQASTCAAWILKLSWHTLFGPRLSPPFDGIALAILASLCLLLLKAARETK